jgi:tryptophan synthase alpha chain
MTEPGTETRTERRRDTEARQPTLSGQRGTPTHAAFDLARAEGRAALVGYLPAGFPSVRGGIDACRAMVDAGVDVVEVGLPYSDPLMDGTTIQRAVAAALSAGLRTADVMHTVEAVAETGAPTLVMSYWNPIERYGIEQFAADLDAAGGAGVITPDLIPDEAERWLAATRPRDLDTVFLVAPSSTSRRLATTAQACRGFVYAASTMGVTGARSAVGDAAHELVRRTRAVTDLPIGVGLGVSSGEQAAEIAAFADGVIVGSALVASLLAGQEEVDGGRSALTSLVHDLAGGVRQGHPR